MMLISETSVRLESRDCQTRRGTARQLSLHGRKKSPHVSKAGIGHFFIAKAKFRRTTRDRGLQIRDLLLCVSQWLPLQEIDARALRWRRLFLRDRFVHRIMRNGIFIFDPTDSP